MGLSLLNILKLLFCRIPGRCWTSAFSVERVLCRMRFVVPVVTPVASHAGEGDQQEPRPGRSGCRRDLRSTSRSGPTARLPVPALSGLRPQPTGRARRECRGPGSRSSPTVRAGRPRARRPRVAPARGRTPARDRPVARTPGRRPSRAGHGRSAGCGPGRWGAAGSGCSERPRHHSTITLSDIGAGENARTPADMRDCGSPCDRWLVRTDWADLNTPFGGCRLVRANGVAIVRITNEAFE